MTGLEPLALKVAEEGAKSLAGIVVKFANGWWRWFIQADEYKRKYSAGDMSVLLESTWRTTRNVTVSSKFWGCANL